MALKFLSDVHATGGTKDSSGDLGSNGQVLSSTGSDTNWVNPTVGTTVIYKDSFTATDGQTVFTLANTVDSEDKTQVYIDGAYQSKGGYTVSGTTLTFDTGLAEYSEVEVMTFSTATANNAASAVKLDTFTGDGSDLTFVLSEAVVDEKVTQVYINGVYQNKSTYSIDSDLVTLRFGTGNAPPNSSAIEVISFKTITSTDGTLTATTFFGDLNGTINTATTATTQTVGDNTTKVATTAFVKTGLDLKANIASPTFTGTVAGITKAMVGLTNAEDTSDADKPVSTAGQTALDLKANIAGPTFTGTPAAPTASAGTNTTQLATTAFVTTGIANIVDSSPATLDTLNELAAALGDDPNFATTVATSIGTKLPSSSVSGTTNYLAKFTGASTIGNSVLQDLGSYISVGGYAAFNRGTLTFTLNPSYGGGNVYTQLQSTGALALATGGDFNRVYIDTSGNLMVGSTDAGNAGSINVSVGVAGTTSGGLQLWAATNQTHYIQFGDATTGTSPYTGYVGYAHSNDSLIFGTSTSTKMTLNASGNLGLGVTPSAWGSGRTAIQIGNTNSYFIGSQNTVFGNNAYNDGSSWRYITSYHATLFTQSEGGEFQWYTAPSGTGGNAISFTQAMTLNASGNLGIGTGSTIYADLEIKRASEVTVALHNSSSITSGNRGNISFYNSSVSTVALIKAVADTDNVGTALEFYTRPVGGSLTNSLTISSTGAATFKAITPSPVVSTPIVSIADSVNGVLGGIGALASGNYPLQIWGGTLEFKTGSSSNIAAATTKLAISSGGDVKIGTGGSSANGLTIRKTGNHLFLQNQSNAATYWNFDVDTNNRMYIITQATAQGVYINDGDTAFTGYSDENLKENIKPLENVLNKILYYKCVEYNFKSDKSKDKKIGFIAQDWDNDYPQITSKGKDDYLGMKYTETIPVLLKAIQEQQTIIEDLKSRIETLEG